jgi:hypothetical protein
LKEGGLSEGEAKEETTILTNSALETRSAGWKVPSGKPEIIPTSVSLRISSLAQEEDMSLN